MSRMFTELVLLVHAMCMTIYSAPISNLPKSSSADWISKNHTIRTPFYRPTWLEIDLNAVHSNVRSLKNYVGKDVHLMAVVKANAYGHGILEVASTSISAGATWLGTATLDEAVFLRTKLLDSDVPILVLGYVAPEDLSLASRLNITVTGVSLDWVQNAAKSIQHPIDFHIKIDTGMNRLGCKTKDELQQIMDIVAANSNLHCTGVFTHFATSEDIEDKSYFYQQLETFDEFLRIIPDREKKIIHCANSGATLFHPEKPFFDMVRVGKALTGPPDIALQHLYPFKLHYVLSLHSTLTVVKQLDANEKIGYYGEYVTREKEWIGTIPIGYADGWRQQFKTAVVLVDGKRVPIIGRVSMDQIMVALPKQYAVGTRVTFIGHQGNESIMADEIAQRANQPRSEVFASMSSRLPRVYIRDGLVVSIRNSLLES